MIVATAGHIDHGKSALVRALTGVDTDRLPEEKARGISIDLGFAYWHGDGGLVGFVDVPGHERFVRNMLAGVAAIDAAMLVVAADDGVMPQTREHLQILDLLDVRRGLAVITKIDRVPPARVAAVADEVRALLADTSLANVPVLPVSAITSEGIAAVREGLAALARAHRSRYREGHPFRLAIDRVFTVAGTGTVVTGTVFSGRVKRNDKFVLSPSGREVRVRGIQIRGLAAESAQAGDRCALSLAGIEQRDTARGDWVVDPLAHAPTTRMDVRLSVLASEPHALAHWTPVHLHSGTASVAARIATPGARPVAPGSTVHAQLVLDHPLVAVNGDRYIVRDHAARRTMGGGVVLDPYPPKRKPGPDRERVLDAMEAGDPAAALGAQLASSTPIVDRARFRRTFNLDDERIPALVKACDASVLGGREHALVVPAARLAAIRDALFAYVDAFHRADPRAAGVELKVLHKAVATELPAEAFGVYVHELAESGGLTFQNGIVARRRHDATANPADERMWARVAPALAAAGFAMPQVGDLARSLRVPEAQLTDFLHRKSKTGEVCRVADDRFYPRATIVQLAGIAATLARSKADGLFTAAEFRDATRIGRTLAIRILEFLDGAGVTRRVGDARRLRRDPAQVYGEASATTRVEQ